MRRHRPLGTCLLWEREPAQRVLREEPRASRLPNGAGPSDYRAKHLEVIGGRPRTNRIRRASVRPPLPRRRSSA